MTKHVFQIVIDRPQASTLCLEPWALAFDIPARTKALVEIHLNSESEWAADVAQADDGDWIVAFMFPVFRVKIGDGDWQEFDHS